MRVELACSPIKRLRGLLEREEYPEILLIAPCNDVHTFGMRHEIDVAFVTAEGLVVESYRNVGSCRRLRCKAASATLERLSTQSRWFEKGDRLDLRAVALEVEEPERFEREAS